MESGGFNFSEVSISVGWSLVVYVGGFWDPPIAFRANAQLLQDRGFPESMCEAEHLFHQEM